MWRKQEHGDCLIDYTKFVDCDEIVESIGEKMMFLKKKLSKKKPKAETAEDKVLAFFKGDLGYDKYKLVEFFNLSKEGYELKVDLFDESSIHLELIDGEIKYIIKLNYGIFSTGSDKLYIDDVMRFGHRSNKRLGSKFIDEIARFAETFGFKYVGLNPKACSYGEKDRLNQEELEDWYYRHLSGKQFKYVIVNCCEEMRYLE